MRRVLFLTYVLCAHLYAANAFAVNHYIRAGATGSGNGNDWTNAHNNLPAALVRGDTYYIADGGYGSYTFDDATSGSNLVYIKKATVSDHGTNVGWDSSYGDKEAVFSSSGNVWTFKTGYYDIDGIVGRGKAPGTYGFRVASTSSRCVGVSSSMLIFASGANINNVAWRHIDFDWNNGTASCGSSMSAIFFTQDAASDNITIENSYFHHSPGFVFYIGPYDPNPGGTLENHYTIRNNYFYMNGGGGGESAHWELMWLMNLDNSNIYNNVMEDTIGSSGQTGWVMLAKADNVNIYGNLFFCSNPNCIVGGNGVIATWSLDAYKNNSIHIYNNTFVGLQGVYTPQIYFIHNSVSDTDIQVKNNLYYNSKFNWAGINTHTNEACGGGQGCAGSSQQTGITTATFLNYVGKDFHLLSATSAGDNTIGSQFNIDMDGNTRGADGIWDRGAFERTSGQTVLAPPSTLRVVQP